LGTNDNTTKGNAYYTTKQECLDEGLCKIDGNVARMSSNHVDVQHYRRSHKLVSQMGFRLGTHFIDVNHMPTGCGNWPALWMFGDDWPNNGEIDILEGVHTQSQNANNLHTRSGCRLDPRTKVGDGSAVHFNCDAHANNGSGCGYRWNNPNSFGKGFNDQKGGVIIMNWTDTKLTLQFVNRSEVHKHDILVNPPQSLPIDIDVSQFGPLASSFDFSKGSQCDNGNQYFGPNKYVINNTFCGDWAGNVWHQYGNCQALNRTCEDYVTKNPQAFKDAYWEINEIRVYNAELYNAEELKKARSEIRMLRNTTE